ncbi:hypothetical protein acsn021_37030 [Anaerocolumna cellulosilytica]|uniref:Uncharacterized protein n=1 Tax=Anaerocolumna cellulosilytica TaxID=433286 RepID=A0A6S6QZP9_9FIRM|nr:CD3324 family protein [Anaerocolumna cellulosilytica]MBB5195029.1 Mor family transcriptional regulator [Anaerocolumna cellulosilytica]BCJ96134.1 hypothetical protein acsn021_37030 [Anaerocolumna cellulosilytica]
MKYIKAENILPESLVKQLQEYVNGDYIYVPRKEGEQRAWGEKSGTRAYLKERNQEIFNKYQEGETLQKLCEDYYLSEQSIRRILREEKKK